MSRKTRRNPRNRLCLRRLSLESLEARAMLYNATALAWDHAEVSYSLVPDGTMWNTWGSGESVLIDTLNDFTSEQKWQRAIATGFQTWANHTNLDFHQVDDDATPSSSWTNDQGDIRIGAIPGGAGSGWASFPGPGPGGNITLRAGTGLLGSSWSETGFIGLLTHEIGHALGLGHSDVVGSVMGGGAPWFTGLTADDIAGIQSMYGVRTQDAFDEVASNNTYSTASELRLNDAGSIDLEADLTNHSDVDYYRFILPSDASSVTVSADARQRSLLAPELQLFDGNNNPVTFACGDFGAVATVKLDDLNAGETYTIMVDGATTDVFGMGAYELAIDASFSSAVPEPIAAAPARRTKPVSTPIAELLDRNESAHAPPLNATAQTPKTAPDKIRPAPTLRSVIQTEVTMAARLSNHGSSPLEVKNIGVRSLPDTGSSVSSLPTTTVTTTVPALHKNDDDFATPRSPSVEDATSRPTARTAATTSRGSSKAPGSFYRLRLALALDAHARHDVQETDAQGGDTVVSLQASPSTPRAVPTRTHSTLWSIRTGFSVSRATPAPVFANLLSTSRSSGPESSGTESSGTGMRPTTSDTLLDLLANDVVAATEHSSPWVTPLAWSRTLARVSG